MPKRRPFASKAQARFMFARHPQIARKMANEAQAAGVKHPIRNLPSKARRKR